MLIVRNNSEFSVSIAHNTNRIVSSSNDNLGGIKIGTYIKLGEEDVLYSTIKNNRFSYNKKFEIVDLRTIKIKGNTGINLQPNDTIKINYDEYELFDILEIQDSGRDYFEGEILTVGGGELSIDISDGFGHPTKLKIEEIGLNGEIEKISINQQGKYIIPPKYPFELNSERGQNAKINLKYSLIDNKSIITRVIKTIQFDDKNNETILGLDYSLPMGVKNGNLSVEKWEVFLDREYKNETRYGISYKLFKDFTPGIELPLLAKNSNCMELLFNNAMIKLDKEISEIKKKIK